MKLIRLMRIERQKKKIYREFDDGKSVLRKAMEDYIPKNVLKRKKQGFSPPDESWYRKENLDYIKETLLNSKTLCSNYINKDFIKKTIDEHVGKEKITDF